MLSALRLGLSLEIIDKFTYKDLNELLVLTQPAHIQKVAGREMDNTERDMARAVDRAPRWQRVGIPVLMSAVSFGVQSYAREQLTSDQSRFIESTTTDSLSSVLAEFAKIKPTLHKNQGDPINIVVARDVDLSSVYALRRSGHGR